MSWRNGSAFAPLAAANTAITVTTTTPIATGERVILVVFRQQGAAGWAIGNPTISTLGGNSFTTLATNESTAGGAVAGFYSGLSFYSFVAPSAIGSGATLTVTPGHTNQTVAAMLIVQGDPHPTETPYADIQAIGTFATFVWPTIPFKKMNLDKRLLIAVWNFPSGGASTPWSAVAPLNSSPSNGFTEALDATQFSYGFLINVREQDSADSELPSELAGTTAGSAAQTGITKIGGVMTLVRSGAVLVTAGSDVLEYNDFPSRLRPGASARSLTGQLWPQ